MPEPELDLATIRTFVQRNSYQPALECQYMSRCIDGRYADWPHLEALAIPGADAGEMAVIMATANEHGLELDAERALTALANVVGGRALLRFHTDTHAPEGAILGGCGHIREMARDPEAYGVGQGSVDLIKEEFARVRDRWHTDVVLHGDHAERAVLIVSGQKSVMPWGDVDGKDIQVFVYHQSLATQRRQALAGALLDEEAVSLPPDKSQDWLVDALVDQGRKHLEETLTRLAKGLPVFEVEFHEDGFHVSAAGHVD